LASNMDQSCMFVMVPQTVCTIPYCNCGFPIVPNGANMCAGCSRTSRKLKEKIISTMFIVLSVTVTWRAQQLCIKKQGKDWQKKVVKLVGENFFWTEPHSKRIKLKLKIQKKVLNGAVLDAQSYVVEYLQQDRLTCVLNAHRYWGTPFKPLFTSRQLVEYIVLDVEPIAFDNNSSSNSKYKLADVHVARVSDFGRNDNIFYIRTHLGHYLNVGECW
ncbi:hypothetical protein Tsubulata_044403, partial [Turnera subulata]